MSWSMSVCIYGRSVLWDMRIIDSTMDEQRKASSRYTWINRLMEQMYKRDFTLTAIFTPLKANNPMYTISLGRYHVNIHLSL